MRIFSFFERSARAFQQNRQYSKFLVIFAVSGGGLVAYSESKSSHGANNFESSQMDARKKKVVVLGTGWAGTTFLRNLDSSLYDVQVVSPRNYFAFTPLLPSVTCGTVEARSIVEPIRRICEKKSGDIQFWEAECTKIDAANKKVSCRPILNENSKDNKEFFVDYDYLVIAMGARVNTFNTPGVAENCHFLKEIEDAQKIRRSIMDCFEKASLPYLSDEERKKQLQFVIVGGGPTGVEFAAALHDFVRDDLVNLYPMLKDLVKITVVEAADQILGMFDKRIGSFAVDKFQRDGIEVKTGYMVVNVSDRAISMKGRNGEITSLPYGMAVWSTGIGTRPIIMDFMKQIGQTNRRVLATDEWLRVEGCDGVYALGDCASIQQRKVLEDISAIFNLADKDKSGTLTVEKFQDVIDDICERYPQVELYLKAKQMRNAADLLDIPALNDKGGSKELDIEGFKQALAPVDSQMKMLPATAQGLFVLSNYFESGPAVDVSALRSFPSDIWLKQVGETQLVTHHEIHQINGLVHLNMTPLVVMGMVAAQEGVYLARCFNRMKEREYDPEGPPRIRGIGRHRFHPFRYKHLGQFAPLGGEQTAAQLPGDWISIGHSSQWLWYSVYASKQVSWRTRMLVMSDWTRRFIFGRDSSCI